MKTLNRTLKDAPLSVGEWEESYCPVDSTGEGYEDYMNYDEALTLARAYNDENPQFHVWTRVDGDDGKLILLNGFRIINGLDYCVTKNPWGDDIHGYTYAEVTWED